MTKVEEWTKADTGVGATIAIGSQGEKGKRALLVKAAIITPKPIKPEVQESPTSIDKHAAHSKNTSPPRIKSIVNIPPPREHRLL